MASTYALVTEAEARAHIRYEDGTDSIDVYIEAASLSAQNHCNRNIYPTSDQMAADIAAGIAGDYPMLVNSAIKAAILMTVGHLYENRQNVVLANTAKSAVALPLSTEYLLQPYRVNIGA